MKTLISALALLTVAVHPFHAATFEGTVLLTLNSTKYCAGASWNLKLSNAAPNAAIRLSGAANGIPWEMSHWADTDANGNFSTNGTYSMNAAGRYTLGAEIGASSSNRLPVEVVNCGWSTTGSLGVTRYVGHTATLLANGKVLVAGGRSAELYDPATGQWSATGSMGTPRIGHIAVRLASGKVLVVGGSTGSGNAASAEIYDSGTGAWSATGSLSVARGAWWGSTATLLADGNVLVTGGSGLGVGYPIFNTAELYDPATGVWRPAGTMNSPHELHTATLLPDGRVLIVGGIKRGSAFYYEAARTSEIYDPATGSWTPTGDPITARALHTATLLPNGKVLVVGGERDLYPFDHYGNGVDKTELYDPATGQWSATGNLTALRIFHTATLLPDGRVLVAGGWTNNPNPADSAEVYNTATGAWSVTGSLNTARDSHTATVLADGRVLVASGTNSSPSTELFETGLEVPQLSLDSTYYCMGNTWSLLVTHPSQAASVRLLGVSNGASWEIVRWGAIDSAGSLRATGIFASGAEGVHTLRVAINDVWSNDLSFTVSNCNR